MKFSGLHRAHVSQGDAYLAFAGFTLAQVNVAEGQIVIVCEGEDVCVEVGEVESSGEDFAGTVLFVFVRGAILEGLIFLYEGCTFIVQELDNESVIGGISGGCLDYSDVPYVVQVNALQVGVLDAE